MSAAPIAMRSHEAQLGGRPRLPISPVICTKIAASTNSPTSQPTMKARPVGLGRGVCNTSTAGIIDSGESATMSASGINSTNTDPQLPDIDRPSV
jgi:hypothetical protein